MLKFIRILILLLALPFVVRAEGLSGKMEAQLEELDATLENRDVYVAVFEERVGYLQNMLEEADSEAEVYELNRRLFEEYDSYNFDLALECGMRLIDVAEKMDDPFRLNVAHIEVARLYTIAGMYAEAISSFGRIDTLRLLPSSKVEYYKARIHFNRDFMEYSKDGYMRQVSAERLGYYRARLYDMPRQAVAAIDNYVVDSLSARLLDHFDNGRSNEALYCAERLIEEVDSGHHQYAIAAYYLSMVYERLGMYDLQAQWLARSAMVDVRLAVKDNASLSILASILSQEEDIERAIEYIHYSIDDAMFYNAKLRPWQVAIRMNTIEEAYYSSVEQQRRNQLVFIVSVSVLALIILSFCIYMVHLLRKTRKAQDALRAKNIQVEAMNEALSETNRQLQALNLSIAEANMVKEEYIGLFLSMCSDYIDKIASMQRRVRKGIKRGSIAELNREFPASDIIDAEKEHFYEVFDSAFLNLYPNFVEEFNSLLEPDGQIELKKGERLNTELRIFALIRLGITDSSKIALLLHYSVNTIYNYRAKVKNRARVDRDNFEQTLRTIGSFKA